MDHAFRRGFKSVAVAVWADGGSAADNRIASNADFVASRVGGDFGSGGCAREWLWVRHVVMKKAAPEIRPAYF